MHTYRKATHHVVDCWEVMFETDSDIRSIKEFQSEINAARFVSFLNGGSPNPISDDLWEDLTEQ